MRRLLALLALLAGIYVLVVHGAVTLDLGIGRRTRALGPLTRTIAAPPETVFDVIAAPYLGRTPRAMQDKLQVWERSSEMALAAHFTPAGRLTTTTVETVRFERPHQISFRLLRGPVPHVAETYELRELPEGTQFVYSGELERTSGRWARGGAAVWPGRGSGRWRRRSTRSRPRANAARAARRMHQL